jgi:hypothetical protein
MRRGAAVAASVAQARPVQRGIATRPRPAAFGRFMSEAPSDPIPVSLILPITFEPFDRLRRQMMGTHSPAIEPERGMAKRASCTDKAE